MSTENNHPEQTQSCSAHSPTPWRVYESRNDLEVNFVDANGQCVQAFSPANAARIVAAVNAADGISNEALESLNWKQYNDNCRIISQQQTATISQLRTALQSAEQERDEAKRDIAKLKANV